MKAFVAKRVQGLVKMKACFSVISEVKGIELIRS